MSKVRIGLCAVVVFSAGCARTIRPPSSPRPVPAYSAVDVPANEAWDAVVDFLIDTGTDFSFISADMRTAKISALLAVGPVAKKGGQFEPNPEAGRFADCGTQSDRPLVGWGSLIAEVGVRVRPAERGALLKVVVPRVRQKMPDGGEFECVSTGEFERIAEAGIRQRLRAITK